MSTNEQEIAQDAVENPEARRVAIEATGEFFELTGPDEEIVSAIATLDGYIAQLHDARQTLSDEMLSRMDRGAKWTLTVGGAKITAPSPTAGEKIAADQLAESMKTLVEDGVIEIEAFDAAFSREVKMTMPDRAWVALSAWVEQNQGRGVRAESKWKLGKAGLNAIVKVAGERGRALVAAATTAGPPRKVKVG